MISGKVDKDNDVVADPPKPTGLPRRSIHYIHQDASEMTLFPKYAALYLHWLYLWTRNKNYFDFEPVMLWTFTLGHNNYRKHISLSFQINMLAPTRSFC